MGAEYKRENPTRAARNKVQQTARRCANEYWQQLSDSIQFAAVSGNIGGMYEGIKTALGPTQSKTANIRGKYEGIKTALGPTQSKTAPIKTTSGEVITNKVSRTHCML